MQNNREVIYRSIVVLVILILILAFLFWAYVTKLDLLTRGSGRVIVPGENITIQVPENGVLEEILIEEGQSVQAGQLLATINPISAQSSLDELNYRKNALETQLIRLDAEILDYDVNWLRNSLLDKMPTLSNAQLSLFIARAETLEQEIERVISEEQRSIKELLEIKRQIQNVTELLSILVLEEAELLPLIKDRVIGSSELFRLQRERSRLENELNILNIQVEKLELVITAKKSEIALIKQRFFENALAEKASVLSQLGEVDALLPKLQQQLKLTEVYSVASGYVNKLLIKSSQAVVRAGDDLIELVPSNETLEVQAYVDPKEIGQIEPNQSARISLTAYDPSKYGYLVGTLVRVSPDAIFREETKSYMFEVYVSIDTTLYDTNMRPLPILPGMVAQIDIIRGKRSVLEYFWQPVAKIKDDAFRQ